MSAIDAACRIFPVATVQNRYNLVDRVAAAGLSLTREEIAELDAAA